MNITFICPMCFLQLEADENAFLNHCGHAMVEISIWLSDKEGWLKSRDYEISFLPSKEQKRYKAMNKPQAWI